MDGCIYCGLSLLDWKDRGKIGCAHCIGFLKEEYTKFIPFQASADWEPPSHFPSYSAWKNLQSMGEDVLDRIDSWALPFSYRFRVARNPKHSIYPKQNRTNESYLGWFLDDSGFQGSNSGKKLSDPEFKERIPWNSGTLVAGDEDHIRWEYVTDSLSELNSILKSDFLSKFEAEDKFDFQNGIGFINSCPTNSGFGDKLSVSIPARLADSGELRDFRLPTDWGFYREELKDRLVFFRKNFGPGRKNSFFNLVSYLALLVISEKDGSKASFEP
ncbi:ATP--guanido phosphotransferase [Leptospira sarikeiensis]|uniref:ATP--guanido phosphotransferase n=1 Tax=Leptospira sarikeiensis TaxID=2484943 RepID=A0A4R9KB21_9LEPT|nr:ATP--guanido phosphotransferase [Leptospira sarikeiensis]TGL63246.1 ATP--guanido phosphotransferase [Leptospira sarikeiensis]